MRKTFRKKKPQEDPKKTFRYNAGIRSEELRVIGSEGEDLGVLKLVAALGRAKDEGMDLVEVSPKATPPVARIIDYGKFKYQQEKQAQKQKLKQKKTEVKGVRLSARIGEHDREMRKKRVLTFLDAGDKVKVELVLRGREHQHTARAKDSLREFLGQIKEEREVVVEQDVTKQGGRISVIIAPKR